MGCARTTPADPPTRYVTEYGLGPDKWATASYFTHHVSPGQRFYILSKLCGLLGLTLFWLQSMTALARFSPALRGFFSLPRLQHVLLGTTTFILLATHVSLFIVVSTLRTGHLALPLLLPKFDQGFYASFVRRRCCRGFSRKYGEGGASVAPTRAAQPC